MDPAPLGPPLGAVFLCSRDVDEEELAPEGADGIPEDPLNP